MEHIRLQKLAPVFFCFQVLILILGLMPAARLAYDNRVERFAVADRQAEQRYKAFTEAFGARNHFIVSLRFDEAQFDETLAENLLTRFRGSPRGGSGTFSPFANARTQPPRGSGTALPLFATRLGLHFRAVRAQ